MSSYQHKTANLPLLPMMNQEDLFKKIGHILSELQEQYQYIAEHPQKLNELEVELMLSNANFLTDHIQIVRKTLHHQEPKVLPQHTETSADPGSQELHFQLADREAPVQNKFDFEEKKVEQLFNRPLTPQEQEIIAKKQSLTVLPDQVTEEPAAPIVPLVVETPIVVEKPIVQEQIPLEEKPPLVIPSAPVVETSIPEQSPKLTLNELLAGNHQGTDKADYAGQEIKDLKQSISLNDRLIYVKDLFLGYNLAYAEVIDLLNKMPDFKSADAFLQHNYAVKNDWKNKQATVDRFYQLLKRRFPVK
jgi:hypothetical protein